MFSYVLVTDRKGKHRAQAWKLRDNENLVGAFNLRNVAILQPTKTYKEAVALAEFWNECYRKNGTLETF